MRQLSYTLSNVAVKLISQNNETNKEFKIELLSGGFEDRFIPSLSDETKHQIEGSFKITGNEKLRELSLSAADKVELTEEDSLLREMMGCKDDASEKGNLAFTALEVL